MSKVLFMICAIALGAAAARAAGALPGFVLVEGGSFQGGKTGFAHRGATVSDFYLGRHEVTQKEWAEVMGTNPSQFKGEDLPVENVSWYDCIEYCNARSLREGLQPCYVVEKGRPDPENFNENDDQRWLVTFDRGANGYRLPTELEWEYAASGGRLARGSTYSGGDDIGQVAWYWRNAGDEPLPGAWNWPLIEGNRNRTHPVGQKKPNELGLHDLSGNVREWCWDWLAPLPGEAPTPNVPPAGYVRVWKGGGWLGGDFCCEVAFRSGFEANGRGGDQGFRVARNK